MRTRMIRLVGTAVLLWVASLPAAADGWKLEADDYTADYTGASTANGMLGILPWKEPFSIRHVVLNHVFELNDRTGVNCAVRGIDPFSMTMRVDGREIDGDAISGWRQTIDMRRAEHTTTFVADGKLRVAYSVIALRNMPYAALIDVEVTALQDAEADFRTAMQVPEGEYRTSRRTHRSFLVDGHPTNILRTDARTAHGRYDVSASSMFIPACEGFGYEGRDDAARLRLRLKAGETKRFTLAGAVCTTRDFSDPYSESERQVIYIAHESVDRVLAGHRRLWDEMWQGDIEIEGDDEAQRVVRFALYNLYASCRAGSRLSIPPMGLSSQGYNGHIFWDAELWMYPPMLLLNEGIARSMVDYRTDRLAAARRRASAYGYRGVMFPWESDWFGEESTPTWAITGPMEHHITADVGIAAWNYYCVTRDREWLRTTGWPLLKEIAAFWVSRVVRNDDGSYSIAGVVGADEYAMNVTDNAFTNGAAKVVLCNAVEAAGRAGRKLPFFGATLPRRTTHPSGRRRRDARIRRLCRPADQAGRCQPAGLSARCRHRPRAAAARSGLLRCEDRPRERSRHGIQRLLRAVCLAGRRREGRGDVPPLLPAQPAAPVRGAGRDSDLAQPLFHHLRRRNAPGRYERLRRTGDHRQGDRVPGNGPACLLEAVDHQRSRPRTPYLCHK